MATTGEKRSFSMHQNLLWDVIERQRGDVSGALMECVTNSIEAGATSCNITVEPTRIVVEDDGRGFATRQEIEAYFEVFGKSDERKAASTKWAAFSMGRAQAWCWGRTTYRTRTFEMVVDLRSCTGEIAYTLVEGLEDRAGCRVEIELYEALEPGPIARIAGDTARTVEYVDTPVTVNGVLVSKDPKTLKWDVETDDAWVRFVGQSLKVYNLGAYVTDAYSRDLGTGAIVVTKKPLKVNFARNSIGVCPVWKRILSDLRSRSKRRVIAKKRLNATEARFVVEQWAEGSLTATEVYRMPILRDTNGKQWSLESIGRAGLGNYALDDRESIRADKAMQAGLGIVLDSAHVGSVLGGYLAGGHSRAADRLDRLIAYVARIIPLKLKRVRREELYAKIELTHDLVAEADYKPSEREAIVMLNSMQWQIAHRLGVAKRRRVLLGRSETAYAWTDANSWIAIDRGYLARCVRTTSGFASLLLTIAHEYAHTEGDPLTHDASFYERFHTFAHKAAELVDQLARSFAWRISKKLTKADERERAARARVQKVAAEIDRIDGVEPAKPKPARRRQVRKVPPRKAAPATLPLFV